MKKEDVIDRRTWLYKKDEEPRIFDGEKEVKAAMDAGWVESPDKVDNTEKPDVKNKKSSKNGVVETGGVDAGQDNEPTGENLDGV